MPDRTIDEQLVKYLTDAHSIEEQALAQLRTAPKIAGDAELSRIFAEHLEETEGHRRTIRERLQAHGAAPSRFKRVVMEAGGKGFVLFARAQPDTPGKLTAHAYSYEHLELASYELLERVAERAGDDETALAARGIRDEEEKMARRLESCFERAVGASLLDKDAIELMQEVPKYLADAHALEAQAIQLLERAPKIGGQPELERIYAEHLAESRSHQARVERRLGALGARPSRLKDAAMRLGALNWGAFFQGQPDTPGKLAAFVFAFEHLEVAGYSLLERTARRAGDHETTSLAHQILEDERAAAGRIAEHWDEAVDASLKAVGAA